MFENIRRRPLLSTLFAATALSACWTTVWILVFLASTWILGAQTGVTAFVLAYWLSVAAESVIRWAENTRFIAYFSKPLIQDPIPDNYDYNWDRAVLLLLLQFFIVSVYLFLSHRIPELFAFERYQFAGQTGTGLDSFNKMIENWKNGIFQQSVFLSLTIGFFFRIAIYKRSHKKSA